jgi:HSP20 family protein
MTNKVMALRNVATPFFGSREPFAPFFERFLNFDPSRGESFALSEDTARGTWVPPVDIRETDEAFVVTAELPGLTKDDIQITLENNVLRLSGERRFVKEEEKDNYHRIERAYGAFSRVFTLGGGVDAERVAANFQDGVLTISVPKKEETKPRRIAIQ